MLTLIILLVALLAGYYLRYEEDKFNTMQIEKHYKGIINELKSEIIIQREMTR